MAMTNQPMLWISGLYSPRFLAPETTDRGERSLTIRRVLPKSWLFVNLVVCLIATPSGQLFLLIALEPTPWGLDARRLGHCRSDEDSSSEITTEKKMNKTFIKIRWLWKKQWRWRRRVSKQTIKKNIKVRREKNAKKKYHEKQKTIKNWTCFFKQDQRKDK